jgi:hypothetical protein
MSIQPVKVVTLTDGSTITLYWSTSLKQYVTVPENDDEIDFDAAAEEMALAYERGEGETLGDFPRW